MKADACDYGDGTALARKGSRRAAAAAEEADDADEGTPGYVLGNGTPSEATPVVANEQWRFEHLGNGDSAAGTAAFTPLCPSAHRKRTALWQAKNWRLRVRVWCWECACLRSVIYGKCAFLGCRCKVQQGPGQQRP